MGDFHYQPDEQPKKKHFWQEDRAGFVEIGVGGFVGKCPRSLSMEEAQRLLDGGIPWSPASWRRVYPQRIYAVCDGVLYRATPTIPGQSCHGFPEHPTRFPRGASRLKEAILERARKMDCESEVRHWMNW